MFQNMKAMKLSAKMLIPFLAVGLIPFGCIGVISLIQSSNALTDQAFHQLESVRGVKKQQIESYFTATQKQMGVLVDTVGMLRRKAYDKLATVQEIKKAQIEAYFKERTGNVKVLQKDATVVEALKKFIGAFKDEDGKVGGPLYEFLILKHQDSYKQLATEYGYDDIYLISKDGDIVYSLSKGSDEGENVFSGSLKDSPLGDCFERAVVDLHIQDFSPYAVLDNRMVAFLAAPVKDPLKNDEVIGVIALRLTPDPVNAIIQRRGGMGRTGETYLIGQTGDDIVFRSDQAVRKGKLGQTVSDFNFSSALSGKSGQKIDTHAKGGLAIVSYDPIEVSFLHWAIISTISLEEAINPVVEGEANYFTKFITQFGYDDLLLVYPDGNIFFSVTRGADYGTNVLDGPYAQSGLGQVIRGALDSKRFYMGDFQPYEPIQNASAAFVAKPLLGNDSVELMVALRLSNRQISHIMQTRSGMGETGRTYLVGADKRMRSQLASSASEENERMESLSVSQALAGKTGADIREDAGGITLLSSYTPIHMGDIHWALIAEVEESEAFRPIRSLKYLFGVVALIGTVVIVVIALMVTHAVGGPINRVVRGLKKGGTQMTSTTQQLSASNRSLAKGASEHAASLEETSSSLEEMSSMTQQNKESADHANALMKDGNQVVSRANGAMTELNLSMVQISEASQETSKIVKTIDEIAFQTNLLALNAAVEAARAGEAGAGFAVVADEVRNLAMRAAEAAKHTSEMIEKTVKRVEDGADLVAKTNEAFSEVAINTGKVGTLLDEIAAASSEQAQGIDQISQTVSEMDKVTQKNAANTEESASASDQLHELSERVQRYVDELVTLVGNASQSDKSDKRLFKDVKNINVDFTAWWERLRSKVDSFKQIRKESPQDSSFNN